MKNLGWWILGAGVVGVGVFAFTRKASAQTYVTSTGRIGGFNVPAGLRLSPADAAALLAFPTDPATPGSVHHDVQEAFDVWVTNRHPDGSVDIVSSDGTHHPFPSLAALLQTCATGGC